MSEPTADAELSGHPTPKKMQYLGRVGRLVDSRAQRLQKALLTQDASWARAALANLRSATRRGPGSLPEIWEWTECGTDTDMPDDPTPAEWAVHISMCMFALHQQGKSEGMHRPGRGFGQAVRLLAGADATPESPVRKRFVKVMSAGSMDECAHHLRGLVTQMRSAQPAIPLDYGMLADDLNQMQYPGGLAKVRLRWSRQFYHIDNKDSDTTQTAQEDTK